MSGEENNPRDHDLSRDAYQERLAEYVRDAEDHLGVARGTIAALPNDGDFVFVLKAYGIVEPLLKEMVKEQVRKAFEHPKVASSGSEAMVAALTKLPLDQLRTIAFELGSLPAELDDFISALAQIRHRYAHNIVNVPLSIKRICEKIGPQWQRLATSASRQSIRKTERPWRIRSKRFAA